MAAGAEHRPIDRREADLIICGGCPIQDTKPTLVKRTRVDRRLVRLFEEVRFLRLRRKLGVPMRYFSPEDWVCVAEIMDAYEKVEAKIAEMDRQSQMKVIEGMQRQR